MKKISVLIVDDEPLARQGIRRLLERDAEIEIVGESADGSEAIQAIREMKPEIVCLDVQMPECDGFQVLDAVDPDSMPIVIFITAYDQHAVRAFEFHALDYLLKPFEDERFFEALNRAKAQIAQEQTGETVQKIARMLSAVRTSEDRHDRIMVKSAGHITFLRVDEIDWVEAQGDYVSLHCQGKKHLIREKISDMENQLPQGGFARIHRSALVNVGRIKEMQPLFHGDYTVVLSDGTRLTMSRSFRDKVFQQLTHRSP